MERKQGFFSALKDEVVRGLSPGRSRGRSPSRSVSPGSGLLRRRRPGAGHHVAGPDVFISRSGSLRPAEALSPLMEGPDPDESDGGDSRMERWGHWMKGQLCRAPSVSASSSASAYQRSDLRLLLSVLGAPLAPVHVSNSDPLPHLSIKDTPIVSLFPASFS
ncbi:hypothetical protein CsSME_00013975 [Camellia sinensis var. sinensis]